MVHEIEALNFADDATEKQGLGWIAHPGVELAVRLVGTQVLGPVVVTSSLGFLGEGDHVGRVLEVPVLMSPELTGSTDASLDLIDNKQNVVLAGQGAELLEKFWAGVVVAALTLNGLNNNGSRRQVPGLDQVLNLFKAGLFSPCVLLGVLVKWVLELGESRLGPVEGRNVKLVDGLGASGRQATKQTAVKASLERQDRKLRRAGGLVLHCTLNFLGSEVNFRATSFHLSLIHEGSLVGDFVGIGTGHGGVDVVKALGSDLQDTSLQDVGPCVGGKVTQRGTIDDGINHLRGLSNLSELGIVVPHRNGGNLSITG